MENWYALDESSGTATPMGPFTREQIEAMVRSGAVRAGTRVAREGGSSWSAAASDPALRELFMGAAPPTSPDSLKEVPVSRGRGSYGLTAAIALAERMPRQALLRLFVMLLIWLILTAGFVALHYAWSVAAPVQQITRRPTPISAELMANGAYLGWALHLFLGWPLLAGAVYGSAQFIAGEGRLGDLFQGFRRFGNAVVAGLLLGLACCACASLGWLPLGLTFGFGALTGQGPSHPVTLVNIFAVMSFLLFGLPMLVVVRLFLAPVIAIDPKFGNIGVLSAFRLSWRNSAGLIALLELLFISALIAAAALAALWTGFGLFAILLLVLGTPPLLVALGAIHALMRRSRLAGAVPHIRSGAMMP